MTSTSLLLQTLRYHWRTNLAVLLGVVAGTAVVSGALVVGDSVRGSLREMTLARLGEVDHVLNGPRYVREKLADELAARPEFAEAFAAAAPGIVVQATFEKPAADGIGVQTRSGKVNLYGGDRRLWSMIGATSAPPQEDEVFLSPNLARQLEVKPGDVVNVAVELPSDIPRDTLLGKRDETAVEFSLTVKIVLDDSTGAARFGLHPDQQLPLNAFVSLATLQERIGLAAHEPSRRDPRDLPARVNAIFVSARDERDRSGVQPAAASGRLNKLVAATWKPADLHARVVRQEMAGYLSLESDRMILDRPLAEAAERAAKELNAATSPVLVYIANEMSVVHDGKEIGTPADGKYSRYSVVAGVNPFLFRWETPPPFGPYEFVPPGAPPDLADRDIVLNDWLADDLQAKIGDTIRLTYHVVGSHGELPEEERRFVVRGILRLDGTIAADRGLTPEVHGITDVDSFDDWDSPFPMKKVTGRDDAYWKKYRATPKAFVSLSAAQKLWSSRYGDLTSVRIEPAPGKSLAETEGLFLGAFQSALKPEALGLAFQPVKRQGLNAASGTTDFGGLFIGFSFFLILSAAILIGLLFRLGIERRAANVGLLLAVGFSHRQVRRLLVREGEIVLALGGVLGLFAAVGYAAVMIHGLKTWWIGAIGTRFLDLHLKPSSLVIGLVIAVAVGLIAVLSGLRGLNSVSPRTLLAGVTQTTLSEFHQHRRSRRAGATAVVCAVAAAAISAGVVTKLIPESEAFAGFSWPTVMFFLVGMLALLAGLSFLSAWLDSGRGTAHRGAGLAGVARLGMRNAARNRSRSVLTGGLIASASFLIVAIGAGHRNPAVETPQKDSGNGGFTLVAESTVPVLYDLNTAQGRAKLGLDDEKSRNALQSVAEIVPFRVNPGENASCLNIYQTRQPTILGVSSAMIERGGFKFVGAKEANPWTVLAEPADDAIPVLGDMNTLQYSLHVSVGQTIEIRGEDNETQQVRISGMFDGSVFQGVLLMSDANFRKLFPSRAGYQYFLVDVPPANATEVADLLESKIDGFDAERVADRLASFLAVQNTYLSTFQTLGGLGLLLGTIGLATVMLRNVLERRAELALLRAVGFRNSGLAWLVLSENALILVCGLFAGSASALLAMLPHLLSTGADVPWGSLVTILGSVLVVGMSAALIAVRGAVQTPVVTTLRSE
jgi:putative ABC transport system permease protein